MCVAGASPDSDALWESPGAVATKDHRTAGLKTTEIYSLTLLGAGGLQSRCQQGPVLSPDSVVTGSPRRSLAGRHIIPVSASVTT